MLDRVKYEDYWKYENLKSKNLVTFVSKELSEKILKVNSKGKSTNLLYLSTMPDFVLFDSPSPNELFKNLKKQSVVTRQFHAQVSQSMSLLFSYAQESTYDLAHRIAFYFSQDPTMHVVFAYSTFPSLFCNFIFDEYAKKANEFLKCIIEEKCSSIVRNSIISAFFFSESRFWSTLYSDVCNQIDDSFTEQELFLLLLSLMDKYIMLLSQHHIDVIRYYFERLDDECTKFIINDLIRNSAILYLKNGVERIDEKRVNAFLDYLQNLDIESISILVKDIFIKARNSIEKPHLSYYNILQRIPTSVCGVDMFLLSELFHGDKKLVEILNNIRSCKKISANYQPFTLYLVIPQINIIEKGKEKEENLAYQRELLNLEEKAKKVELNIFQYWRKNYNKIPHEEGFDEFMKEKYTHYINDSFQDIEKLTTIKEIENELSLLYETLGITYKCCASQFTNSVVPTMCTGNVSESLKIIFDKVAFSSENEIELISSLFKCFSFEEKASSDLSHLLSIFFLGNQTDEYVKRVIKKYAGIVQKSQKNEFDSQVYSWLFLLKKLYYIDTIHFNENLASLLFSCFNDKTLNFLRIMKGTILSSHLKFNDETQTIMLGLNGFIQDLSIQNKELEAFLNSYDQSHENADIIIYT